jgi:hypothetical protein
MIEKGKKPISLQEASRVSPYSADYLSLILRKGKLEGFKKDGKWFTTEEALEDYTQRVAEANFQRQEELNVRIPAVENRRALANLKWALALAMIFVFALLAVWQMERGKNTTGGFLVEKDEQNNLIIRVENPDEIKSVRIVPKE